MSNVAYFLFHHIHTHTHTRESIHVFVRERAARARACVRGVKNARLPTHAIF